MSDCTTTLVDLIRLVDNFRDTREWGRFHSPRNLASAISIEAAELLEIFQWRDDTVDFDVINRAATELADIVIYCLNFASVTGIDISNVVRAKMEHNAAKYPPCEKGLEGWDRNHAQ